MAFKNVLSRRHFVTASVLVALFAGTMGAFRSSEKDSPLDEEGRLVPSSRSASAHAAAKRAEDKELQELLKGRFVDSVSVDMVMVPAVVEDRKGRPVLSLKKEDFRLLEEGKAQRIDYFVLDQAQPVSIAFLVDVSGSMRMSGKAEVAKEAVRHFLSSLRKEDEASLIAFADRQVAVLTEFGADRTLTLKYLQAVKSYGQTALNDAIAATPELVDRDHNGRKAIILLTDGIDNFSTLSLNEAMTAARAVDVPIYTIGFATQSREVEPRDAPENQAVNVLRQVADETGGVFFMIHDPDEMKEAVKQIEEDLRSQYVLGYSPTRTARDGKFRRIALVADNGRYTVRTRKGYVLSP